MEYETILSEESTSTEELETPTEVVNTEENTLEGQPEGSQESELTPGEIFAQMENEGTPVSDDLLKSINELGAVFNGQPIEIKDANHLKELIQKGHDYTHKTMDHSNVVKEFNDQKGAFEKERQEFEAQRQEFEAQNNELTQIKQTDLLMGQALQKMQAADPDLFNEFVGYFNQERQSFEAQLPYQNQLNSEFKSLRDEIQGLKQKDTETKLTEIKNTWDSDLKNYQTTHAPALAKLGIKPDWEKVKGTWAADSSGNMTVDQAVNAVYGGEIVKAFQSRQKLLETKAKTSNAMLKNTGLGGSSRSDSEITRNIEAGNYESILRA